MKTFFVELAINDNGTVGYPGFICVGPDATWAEEQAKAQLYPHQKLLGVNKSYEMDVPQVWLLGELA